MKKIAILSVVFLIMLPSSAFAGCANYIESSILGPAPKVIICYKDKCDKTTLDWQCANVFNSGFGYAVGWQVSYSIDEKTKKEDVKIFWKKKAIDVSDHVNLSCYPIDENRDSCGFPNLKN